MKSKPITYILIVQCIREEIGVMAKFTASTPFPAFERGSFLLLGDCEPRTWDVTDSITEISVGEDNGVICITRVVADSPVVENFGFVVRKQDGEEVGPSETRFRRDHV